MWFRSLLVVLLLVSNTAKSELLVLTSFPESFVQPFRAAFQQQFPDTNIRFLNKKTPAIVAHLAQHRTPKPDLVWVSSPDAMNLMLNMKAISEPTTFAWSELGFFWSESFTQQNQIREPKSWSVVLSGDYHGLVGMSAPIRSGTNHLIIEAILQQHGWQKGWALISQLGGQLATLTARSFGVKQGILRQRFAVAPTIDFFYKSARENGHPVKFVSLPDAPLIPAQVAKTRNAPLQAENFVSFLLSQLGQDLLEQPQINRISLRKGEHKNSNAKSTPFNAQLSAARYHTVNQIFDVMVEHRLPELQRFYSIWHNIDLLSLSAENQERANNAMLSVVEVPIDEAVATDPKLNQQLSPQFRYDPNSQRMIQRWQVEQKQVAENAIATLRAIEQSVDQGGAP